MNEEKTKKCPYCAETIKYEAILCRYCGKELPRVDTLSPLNISDAYQSNISEPAIWTSLFFMFITIVLVTAMEVGILFTSAYLGGSDESLAGVVLLVNILGRLTIAVLAVSGYKPAGAKTINYIGMIIMAFLPLLSWIACYYSGKAIARKLGSQAGAVILGIIGLCFVVSIIGYTAINQYSLPPAPNAVIQPTKTLLKIRATQTKSPSRSTSSVITGIRKASPVPDVSLYTNNTDTVRFLGKDCIFWESLTNNHIDRRLCVYGRIVKINTTNAYIQIIRFSDQIGTFLLRGENKGFDGVKRGDCVAADGIVRSNSSYPYMEIEYTDLYSFDGCP